MRLAPPFKLNGGCATLLKTSRIPYGLADTEMKAKKGHISHKQGMEPCARDRLEVVIHHRHVTRQSAVESEADIANAVPNQDNVDDRIGDACSNRVLGGSH